VKGLKLEEKDKNPLRKIKVVIENYPHLENIKYGFAKTTILDFIVKSKTQL
jgi:hypothetical protein